MSNDYPLKGPPSIDLRTFQSILVSAHSPAAGEAPAIFTAAMRYGIDPAVLLAVMQHESSFGKVGVAVGRHNLFGSRYYPGAAAFGATNRGGWAAFPNYAASASYTAALLASKSYAGAGLTARTFPTRYAPSSDGNNPAAYGSAIVNAINRWRGEPLAPASAGKATAGRPASSRKVAVAKGLTGAHKAPSAGVVTAAQGVSSALGGPLPLLAIAGLAGLLLLILLL